MADNTPYRPAMDHIPERHPQSSDSDEEQIDLDELRNVLAFQLQNLDDDPQTLAVIHQLQLQDQQQMQQNPQDQQDQPPAAPAAPSVGFLQRFVHYGFGSKFGTILWIVHTVAVTIAVSTVVGVETGTACDQPLKAWNLTLMGTEILSLMISFWTALVLKCSHYDPELDLDEDPRWRTSRTQFRLALSLRRIVNMFWMFWFIMGIIWVFKPATCKETSPAIYTLTLTLVLIHVCLVGLIISCCCCGLVIFGLLWVYNPDGKDRSKTLALRSKSSKSSLKSRSK